MFELTIRLIGAGLATFAAGMLDSSIFDFAWKVALVFGIYSVVAYQLELKGMRNAGISGFIAVADSIVISLMLSKVEHLQDLDLSPSRRSPTLLLDSGQCRLPWPHWLQQESCPLQ